MHCEDLLFGAIRAWIDVEEYSPTAPGACHPINTGRLRSGFPTLPLARSRERSREQPEADETRWTTDREHADRMTIGAAGHEAHLKPIWSDRHRAGVILDA